MKKISSFLHRSFIAPFLSKGRITTYMGAALGSFGFAAIMTYFSYDFARLGPLALILFFLVRLGVAGFIAMPLAFYAIYTLRKAKAFIVMITIQILSMVYILIDPSFIIKDDLWSITLTGLLFSVMAAPFWAAFHINMMISTSDENMGNEVSIASIIMFASASFGTVGSGFALAYFPGTLYVSLCFMTLIGGAVFLALSMRGFSLDIFRTRHFNLVKTHIRYRKKGNATMFEGGFQFLSGFLAPVWMWAIGIQSVTMGLLMAIQGGIKFLISPIAGHLFHENKTRDVVIGGAILPLGWVPWIFIHAPWVMLLSSAIWALGQHLYSIGLGSRWYKQRCLAAQGYREMMLGVGRCITAIIVIPILYYLGVTAFFVAAFLISLIAVHVAIKLQHHENNERTQS